MREPVHSILQPGARWTNERIAGVGFVALLHVIAIWAILSGLTQKIVKVIEKDPIELIVPVAHQPPPPPVPPMPHVEPTDTATHVIVPPPPINIARDTHTVITGSTDTTPPQPPAPDTSASGVANTHSIPDYPALARRLGEQGNVRLSLSISAMGDVTAATVVQSSGFADLDQAAVDWVIGHWKYKPATHAGVAVSSQTQAIVVFNLKNARNIAPCKSPWGDGIEPVPLGARSSAGEHYLDMVGVTGSIPVAPTIPQPIDI